MALTGLFCLRQGGNMPASFTLRPAIPQDAPHLARIAGEAYSPYIPLMGREPAPMGADYAAHIAQDTCFVVMSDEQLVGFAVLISKADGWWLETIATAPDHQGKGAGAALLAYAEAFLRAEGLSSYQLYTNEVMSGPYDWYSRSGFVETRRAIQDGFARIFMRKEL